MLKDVTLGQFFPGQTPIHKLDPRTKLVLVIVYIVALFLAKWFVSYVVIAAFLAIVIAMSKIRLKVVLKNLKPLLFIIILTALLNLFYGQGEPAADPPCRSAAPRRAESGKISARGSGVNIPAGTPASRSG